MEAGPGDGSRFEKRDTGLTMSSLMPVGAGELLRHPSFLSFLLSRSLSRFASQIGAVAIGWQVYDMTGSAFDLGMIGLVQFLPTALLLFVAGHAADRYERKRVVQLCQVAEGLTALFLAWGAYAGRNAAVDRAAGIAAARHRDLKRCGANRHHFRARVGRSGLRPRAERGLWDHGGVFPVRRRIHGGAPAGPAGRGAGCRDTR